MGTDLKTCLAHGVWGEEGREGRAAVIRVMAGCYLPK